MLLCCLAVISCTRNTGDPAVTLGDVSVPTLDCADVGVALDNNAVVSMTVPVNVEGTLSTPQICWVGIFQYLGPGDEVGDQIACGHATFDQSENVGFSFDLLCGDYAVIIGITPNMGQECYLLGATTTKGPIHMGRTNPPKVAKIEYSCMAGCDIRGPVDTTDNENLYKYARKRFDQGLMQLSFQEHDLSLPAQVFTTANGSNGLNDFLLRVWARPFLFNSTDADFCLIGIRNCVDRDTFYGADQPPLPDSAVGLSGPLTGNPDSLFGKQTGAWSLIFKEHIDSVLNQASQQKGYNRNAVHELGHALAGLSHPEERPDLHNGGSNSDCVMGMMEVILPIPGDIGYGKDKFCKKCVPIVEAATWVSGRMK